MVQRMRMPRQQSKKPIRTLLLVLLLVSAALLLFKSVSHHRKNNYTHQAISLPDLEDEDFDVDDDGQQTTSTKHAQKDNQWQMIKPQPGDSLAIIFNRLGLSAGNLQEVLHNNPHAKILTQIRPSEELQFLIAKNKLIQLIVPYSSAQSLVVYQEGNLYKTRIDSKKTTKQNLYLTATVKGSLYTTAKRANIPYQLIRQMTGIFKKDINFSAIQVGDRFSMIYEASYIDDKLLAVGNIIAVSYTNKEKTVQAVRYGDHDYFTPEGLSFKKAFSRYPLNFSHISSPFSLSRYHPILHYSRPHKGIDLAAPIGTPIRTIGDGVITTIGRNNGYGNMIKIKHDRTYSTVYAHMLKFQKGLSRGSKVKRGQVIGYVGQSGLADGPHCHFELHMNNHPKNPATTPLPKAAAVPVKTLRAFRANAKTLLARLKLYEEATLASAGKQNIDLG